MPPKLYVIFLFCVISLCVLIYIVVFACVVKHFEKSMKATKVIYKIIVLLLLLLL